jgi:hypothetical protein
MAHVAMGESESHINFRGRGTLLQEDVGLYKRRVSLYKINMREVVFGLD